jgi:type IV pilus assembly protein PilV
MKTAQFGATLLEVMIAVTIIGFGLIGMAGMQGLAISMNQGSYYRGVAADLGNDLSERIRALRSPVLASADANPAPPKSPNFAKCIQSGVAAPTCGPQDADRATYEALVLSEMTSWNNLRISQLPAGSSYTLTAVQSGTSDLYRYSLSISWIDDRSTNTAATYNVVIE